MRKLLIQMLSLLLVLFTLVGVVAGCGNAASDETQTEKDSETAQSGDESETAAGDNKVTIWQDNQSDFTLMRSDTCSSTLTNRIVAFKKAVKTKAGVELGISTDWVNRGEPVPADTLEILVGETNRQESIDAIASLESGTYVIMFKHNRLVITGKTETSTMAALNYFESTYLTEDGILKMEEGFKDVQTFDPGRSVLKIAHDVIYKSGFDVNDTARFIVSLQGLLNAQSKDLGFFVYIMNESSDTFWLNYMMQEDHMLYLCDTTEITSWDAFWEFAKPYALQQGLVLWDPDVPATANVAATICGVDGYIPVKNDSSASSLHQILLKEGLEVKQSLVDMFEDAVKGGAIADTDLVSSGSSKCDAYLWALDRYIDKTNPYMTAYVLDGASCLPDNKIYQTYGNPDPQINQIFNHDYLIMKKCFFWDLSVVKDELPCDDLTQPMGTDYNTACQILQILYENAEGQMVQCIGFPMWWMKYTVFHNLGKTGEVALEWKFAEIISTYNCVMEADAASPCWLVNGSVYTQYELKKTHYENNNESNSEPLSFDKKTRYFTIYLGDYDCSAWLKNHIPTVWEDKTRGTLPLMWGFNPNLSDRVPMVFEYIYETMTPNDYIVTGDSGAGYANPSALFETKLRNGRDSAIEAWIDYNEPYAEKFSMDLCGFLLNGSNAITATVLDMYSVMYPAGSFTNQNVFYSYNGYICKGLQMDVYDGYNIDDIYRTMANRSDNFSAFRTICRSPSFIAKLVNDIITYGESQNDGYTYVYVDPYQFFDLAAQSGQAKRITK
ncbi:MAG: hypothetical protein J6023_00305 [Clostridia bacterium]|nr:hypothetical protein [Clostridia bacterium]